MSVECELCVQNMYSIDVLPAALNIALSPPRCDIVMEFRVLDEGVVCRWFAGHFVRQHHRDHLDIRLCDP